ARWELAPVGGPAFDGRRTLAEIGLIDGAVLHLRDATASADLAEPSPGPELDGAGAPAAGARPLLPQERTRLALPARVPLRDRLAALARAVLRPDAPPPALPLGEPEPGQIVDPSSLTRYVGPPPLERARGSWRATD